MITSNRLIARSINIPLHGQTESGDGLLIQRRRDGWLLAHWDVCGKGHGTAPIHAYVKTVLRRHPELGPFELLERLHRNWPSDRFADALIACLDPKRETLRIALAGRHGVVIRTANGCSWQGGVNRGLLGVETPMGEPAGDTSCRIARGSWIVSTSDGLLDLPAEELADRRGRFERTVCQATSVRRLIESLRRRAVRAVDDVSVAVVVAE